ncbi:MAG TPA: XRE family transcriptional regulator [Bacteroidota bacterium]|nr:XRE family transcriptional regulator [Bacteroidota bacterium]
MKVSLAARIREARVRRELDQAALAARIDVASRTVQRWEKGDQVPDSNFLLRIAKVTGVSAQWLLSGEGDVYSPSHQKPNILPLHPGRLKKIDLVPLPLLSSVPAGTPGLTFHPDYVEKYITVDDVRDSSAFALEVKGNSMAPRIENGDIIVVSPKREARSGDICVVRVEEEDTVKLVRLEDQFIHLIPLNPEYEPMVVRKKDVTFVWRVVKVIKSL